METEKKKLRELILGARDAMPPDDVRRTSSLIEKHLVSVVEFARARTIMFYLSKGNEVDTHGMVRDALRSGKRVVVPFCPGGHHRMVPAEIRCFSELECGRFGVLQPRHGEVREVPPEQIELFIVPGVAFDAEGYRLGRGRGYYDRLLEAAGAAKIALAYDFQVVERVPREAHDVRVDIVVTETGAKRISTARRSG
ncbi:MAG TPA: 5-formyltetrahydrofolate cyclo-ligase [bacterium]|nr:5-formyltetrahydrofolate cyclo-ligase [bacterium]